MSKIYQSPGAIAMAKGLGAVTQSPKCPVLPEESEDKEEPAQDSSVDCEEDDDADNAEGDDDSKEDEESKDQRGVGVAERPIGGSYAGRGRGDDGS